MTFKDITFPKKSVDFNTTLKQRVQAYFDQSNQSKYANTHMVIKTIVMILIYVVPYALMFTGWFTSNWIYFLCWVTMGFGMVGIGTSIMHDANHGAYSSNRRINGMMGYIVNLIGGYHNNWKLQHNVLHHSYTNIDGADEDINPGKLMRFSPHSPRRKAHKLQHIYAWPLYGLMTVLWITAKDFTQLTRYKNMDLLKTLKRSYASMMTEIFAMKVFYYIYALILPLIFFPTVWWLTVIFFFIMHFIAGLSLGAVFQAAHVMPELDFPLPDDKGKVENHWAIHQLRTTANFAPKSTIFAWFIGGLNHQVEHHLFPQICHIHYPKISKIVKQTAAEFNIPYHSEPTFFSALKGHTRMLYNLGHYDEVAYGNNQ